MESDGDCMSFQTFCQTIASPEIISPTSTMNGVPKEYQDVFDALVSNMKTKMNRLDRIEVVFIQMAFSDMDKVCDILDTHYQGEIDDNLACELSHALYHTDFDNLVTEEMAVIKVLAVYLMIQSHINE